jgi:putative Mn2+ efflux pump MntP
MIRIATCIDAMAVGLSLSLLGIEILIPSLIIGNVTLALSLFGLLAGGYLEERFRKSQYTSGMKVWSVIGGRT